MQSRLYDFSCKVNESKIRSSSALYVTATPPALSDDINPLCWKLGHPKNISRIVMVHLKAGLKYWWCFPLTLLFVPLYAFLVVNKPPTMPSWWPMKTVNICPLSTFLFLASNIAYFASGFVLLMERRIFRKPHPRLLPELVFSSGTISAFYHAFQSCGSKIVAETLCYIDHGIAITTSFYFLQECGFPRIGTLALGIAGLVCLGFYPGNAYPTFHSIWHFISAAVIVRWANDSIVKRQKFISRELLRRRVESKL